MAQSQKVILIEADSTMTNTDVFRTKEAAALLRIHNSHALQIGQRGHDAKRKNCHYLTL